MSNCGRLTGKPRSQTVFSLSNCSSLRGNRRGRGVQYESSIVSLAPLQLAVANTSLQCMCCLGNTRYLAQGCVLFRSVLCPAWLGSPVCPVCPCCPFTWPFTAQHSCWPEKSAKIFFTPLALFLSLFRFSLLLLVFMVCQLTRLLHLFNTNRVQLGKPKGTQQGVRCMGGMGVV